MGDSIPTTFFTVADADEAAKQLARGRMRRETYLVIEFPANAELLAMRPEDVVGSSVNLNGTAMRVSSWRETWDAKQEGLATIFFRPCLIKMNGDG